MKILVLNSGSSSLKYQVIDMDTEEMLVKGNYERIGQGNSFLTHKVNGEKHKFEHPAKDHEQAIKFVLTRLVNPHYGVLENLEELEYEDLLKESAIAKLLGYEYFDNYDEVGVYPKGYRILSKVPRMPSNIVENLVESFKSFQHILAADIESLDDVDGIGEVRARTIKQSLKRMQEQFVFDNII